MLLHQRQSNIFKRAVFADQRQTVAVDHDLRRGCGHLIMRVRAQAGGRKDGALERGLAETDRRLAQGACGDVGVPRHNVIAILKHRAHAGAQSFACCDLDRTFKRQELLLVDQLGRPGAVGELHAFGKIGIKPQQQAMRRLRSLSREFHRAVHAGIGNRVVIQNGKIARFGHQRFRFHRRAGADIDRKTMPLGQIETIIVLQPGSFARQIMFGRMDQRDPDDIAHRDQSPARRKQPFARVDNGGDEMFKQREDAANIGNDHIGLGRRRVTGRKVADHGDAVGTTIGPGHRHQQFR